MKVITHPEEWGEVFGDDVMAAALIDRLLHHWHIINIRGNSCRMRQHTELWRSLNGGLGLRLVTPEESP